MKIATYRDGSRDGQLIVVSRDLSSAHYATGIASRLQQVLDDWNFMSPQLEELSQSLNHGKTRHAFAFDPKLCMAPLPRAHFLAEADAATTPPSFTLGRGGDLLGAREPLRLARRATADDAVDQAPEFELEARPQLAVVTGDLAAAVDAAEALAGIRLLMLANHWHLANGVGAIATTHAPVAVTPEELGAAWHDGRIDAELEIERDGRRIATSPTGAAAIGALLARCAALRGLRAGSIAGIGAGSTAAGADAGRLRPGALLRLTVHGRDGLSIFGSIEQTIELVDRVD